MTARKRRIRSPHPGVKIGARSLPSGRVQWRARFIDPDTGRETDVTLDPLTYSTAEARRRWAIAKAKTLAKRRGELDAGGEHVHAKALTDATADYLETARARLRGETMRTYANTIARFVAWAVRAGVRTTVDLTRARLSAYRDHCIRLPKSARVKGGKRGDRHAVAKRRAPLSVNRDLRPVKTLLNAWRAAGLVQLDSDAIADSLKLLPVTIEQPEYLAPAALAKLLHAALRHDAAVFAATREEHAGQRPLGTTRRYDPIAPFMAILLLTGMRKGEALGLKWADVDLDAVDATGATVGEIRLTAAATKTKRARTIGLEVSPALRVLLAALKLRADKDAGHVFEVRGPNGERNPYSDALIEPARKRLLLKKGGYGALAFSWQALRSTCGTYLTNAPAIFGAATVYMSARQLGHSVAVAEKHYLGVHRGIPREARTLEAAMQIEDAMRDVLASVSGAQLTTLTAMTTIERMPVAVAKRVGTQ